jgi:hypothetical protein
VTIPLSPGSYDIEHFRPPEKVNGHRMPNTVARNLGGETAPMLLRKELPEIKFIVPGYVTEGLTILAGKGKIGKSWLALGIAVAVACGGYALGSIEVEQGDVLYLALEDNERPFRSGCASSSQAMPHPIVYITISPVRRSTRAASTRSATGSGGSLPRD